MGWGTISDPDCASCSGRHWNSRRGHALSGEGSRRNGVRTIVATTALLSLLLASCASTSDGDSIFGFTPGAAGPAGAGDFARPTVNSAASASPAGVFEFDDSDPLLPDAMTELPQSPPGREPVAAAVVPATSDEPVLAQDIDPEFDEPQVETSTIAEPAQRTTATATASASGGFLSSFFGNSQAPTRSASPSPSAGPVALASASRTTAINPGAGATTRPAIGLGGQDLPGVRQGELFQIERRASMDDDGRSGDVPGSYRVASMAPGLARLAPNGLVTQTDRVDVNCLQPALVRKLNQIERHFGRRVIVTSGYRSPPQNRRARGASNSLHMYCAAADIQIDGVSKGQLAEFVRNMPGRGGVGTYCHTESVHVDIGPERDWNWRCRRRN